MFMFMDSKQIKKYIYPKVYGIKYRNTLDVWLYVVLKPFLSPVPNIISVTQIFLYRQRNE